MHEYAEIARVIADQPYAEEITDLLQRAKAKGDVADERAKKAEAETWALAYILAEIMDGAPVDPLVDDLPSEVRRRVIAIRHASSFFGRAPAQDQYGSLPTPPPRASVMRSRVRDIDVEPEPQAMRRWSKPSESDDIWGPGPGE